MNQKILPQDAGAPFSQEAEEATIGSVLINPDSYPVLASIIKPSDFFFLKHEYIWQAFRILAQAGDPIDAITLAEVLENQKVLDDIGGRAYLLHLANKVGTSVHAEAYAQLVERTALRRNLMEAADEMKDMARDETLAVEYIRSEAYAKLDSALEFTTQDDAQPFAQLLSEFYDDIEYLLSHKDEGVGIPSGFRDLDQLFNGFRKTNLITFGGRPSMGKTAFMISKLCNQARLGHSILIISLEMGWQQLLTRIIATEAGINTQKLTSGNLTPQEASRFVECLGRIAHWRIFIWDKPSLTIAQLEAQIRKIKHQHGLDIVMVDYVQLMDEPSIRNNRQQEVSYISRKMKMLAMQYQIVVFQNAQLSRNLESRKDKRPILSDLRETGSLEQDSDIVMFIYRDEVYNEATEFPNQADIIVAKHRNGPTGIVSLYFEKSLTKFMDASVHKVDLSDLA